MQELEAARQSAKLREGMKDVWQRVYEAVMRVATTLKELGKKFTKTLAENIVAISEMLPGLNIAGDAKLTELQSRIKEKR